MCEIKVVADMRGAARWTDQLVLYCALALAGGVDVRQGDCWTSATRSRRILQSPLEGVAVYFARYGQWAPLRVAEVISPRQLSAVSDLPVRRR